MLNWFCTQQLKILKLHTRKIIYQFEDFKIKIKVCFKLKTENICLYFNKVVSMYLHKINYLQ